MQFKRIVAQPWRRLQQASLSGVVMAFIVVIVVMSITSTTFFTARNLTNLIRQSAVLSIVAIGQTMVIISGGIDLSVAPIISLSTVLTASFISNNNMNWVLSASIAIIVCALCGLLNGTIITFLKIPPIIATLATSMAYQGFCLLFTKGYGINLPLNNGLTDLLGRGKILGFPISGIVMIGVYILFYLILKFTKVGRVIYGLGGSAEAVRLSGISIEKYKLITYIVSGIMAGFAGVLLTGRLNGGHSYNGAGFDMDSIAAAVLGGVSVTGGIGNSWGTLLGVLILTMITNGLNMINMNTYVQMMIKGLIIVAAIGFGSTRKRR